MRNGGLRSRVCANDSPQSRYSPIHMLSVPPHPVPPWHRVLSGEQLAQLVTECADRMCGGMLRDARGGVACDDALRAAVARGAFGVPPKRATAHIVDLRSRPGVRIGCNGVWRGVLCVTGTVDVWIPSGLGYREMHTLQPGDCACGSIELVPAYDRGTERGYVVLFTEATTPRIGR